MFYERFTGVAEMDSIHIRVQGIQPTPLVLIVVAGSQVGRIGALFPFVKTDRKGE